MLSLIGQALFFFLPGYAANSAPVFLARFQWLESLNVRVDGGKRLGDEPLFGTTKTWRGIMGGVLAGMVVALLQVGLYAWFPQIRSWFLFPYELFDSLILGFLMGLGVGMADLLKSFIKRRLGRKSMSAFIPFDQMDFLGGLLLAALYVPVSTPHLWALVILSPLAPLVANLIAYKMRWKKVWW